MEGLGGGFREYEQDGRVYLERAPPTEDESMMTSEVISQVEEADSVKFKQGDVPDEEFDAEQLQKGVEIEKEHTDNPEIAKQIAKAHLKEDVDYYVKLEKMVEGKSRALIKDLDSYVDKVGDGILELISKLKKP